MKNYCLSILLALFFLPSALYSCTTILIGNKLTADGSVIHAHNEDMGMDAVGRLWVVKPQTYPKGSMLKVPYASIPQPVETWQYWASGNAPGTKGLGILEKDQPYSSVLVGMNQWGLTMSCNWMYSKEENMPEKGIRRYAIRQLILERAKTAREAVQLIADFIEEYGQADWSGLTYCLADSREAWIVETTTRHWVARRVRDDEIWVVANRFTIGSDYDLASEELEEFAKEMQWVDPAKQNFSFRNAYGRPDRMSQAYDIDRESRVIDLLEDKKGSITPRDMFIVLRDRYEGTSKYAKPLPAEISREYCEGNTVPRALSTNICQSSSVAHLRPEMPTAVGSVMWYAMAAPNFSEYFPIYAGATTIPEFYSSKNSEQSEKSAWWTFKMLQKTGDDCYDAAQPLANSFWAARHSGMVESQQKLEKEALDLIKNGHQNKAEQLLADFTNQQATETLLHAEKFLEKLQGVSNKAGEGN